MDTTSEKVLMQTMLECVEAQAKVLKEIIGHLFEIEKEEVEKYEANHKPSKLTQEAINHVMVEGKVCLPLPNFKPQLRGAPRPWTFKRAHVNNFFESGEAGLWEDYDWLEWTLKVGTTQVIPARFMIERNIDLSSNDNQYFVTNKEEEGDDEILAIGVEMIVTGSLTRRGETSPMRARIYMT
nr:hypothetical protein CFP56_02461 [Quercus suber]POE86095.1 hypothetical protein CFP56_02462 [Quercus suber]